VRDERTVKLMSLSSLPGQLPSVATTGELTAQTRVTRSARTRPRRLLGGAEGNARLTSLAGGLLTVLLMVEGVTLLGMQSLLSVHVFVGMLLIGPVALKLGATGYRFVRYYTGAREYVENGPPTPLMRVLVAPVLVLSTVTLLGSGVGLLVAPGHGLVLGLHKASFIVWSGAFGIHFLVYAIRAGRHFLTEFAAGSAGGRALRLALLVAALAAGVALAVLTYPLAAPWLHGTFRFDG
jgi:hypothetical protein